ncbi:helix-turn-helix domain-containing protein [Embleya scabrispora]|uniref:helix-turn-helix domain-containing protein n=1 Tax=Embleya scabrispora TaxID=159449 RepID=UPI00037B6E36|nr:helix-turn-helix domain-containing protein [Embleya scabrispora]
MVRITRWTLDRWILEWRQGGFDALVPSRCQSQPRTLPEVVEPAMALKKENPDRTAAQVSSLCGPASPRSPPARISSTRPPPAHP